ncbi:MAG: type II CAAX endopeptidase family protein [Bacteroidota bacterium]|nr:type II CAAX endopeptidase family protein [Bacteroidota bacterium]
MMEEQNPSIVQPEPQLISPHLPFIERHRISPISFALISLMVIFVLYQIVGGALTLLIFGLKPTVENITGFRLATGISQIIFILIPSLLLVRLASITPKEYIRWKLPTLQTFVVPMIGIFSLQQMLQIYLIFQERLPLPDELQSMMEKFKQLFEELYKLIVASTSIPELFWVIFIVALIPAISEEILFRGLVQRSIEKSLTPMRGVIITGIIFGAYHLNPFSFIPLVIIGIYLGYITMRSGSIWVAIGAHFYNNLFACISMFLNLKDDYVIVGNASEMDFLSLMLLFWFFGIIFLISILYFIKITKPTQF